MKLKVLLFSDLHFEFMRDGGAGFVASLDPSVADVLVIAGDLCPIKSGLVDKLEMFCDRFARVVFVSGNHEVYGSSTRALAAARASASKIPNLHWLHRSTAEIGGVRFVGCTLWFQKTLEATMRAHSLNDFHVIKDFAPWVYNEARADAEFLARTVERGDFVVTHHLPSQKSVAPEYAGSPLNVFFVHDVEATIARKQPRVWAHGHTHGACDYRIGETRVVCNPHGYARIESQEQFNDRLVIEAAPNKEIRP